MIASYVFERGGEILRIAVPPKTTFTNGYYAEKAIKSEREDWAEWTYVKTEYPEYDCVCCGKHEEATYIGNEGMTEKKLCFSCNIWEARVGEASDPGVIIVDGYWYSDAGDVANPRHGQTLGFAGRRFRGTKFDGTRIDTNNMWGGGEIPVHFRDRIPDNATFENVRRHDHCWDVD